MSRFHYGHGAALALVSAGPSFVLLLVIGQMLFDPSEAIELWSIPPVLLIAMVFGMVIALLPILLGGLAMAYLGVHSTGARHPVAWAGAGALIGMLIAFAFDNSARFGLLLPFLLNGAICALLVRYGTRWDDDSA